MDRKGAIRGVAQEIVSTICGSRSEGKVVRECRWEGMPELSLLTQSSAETGRKGEKGGSIAPGKRISKSPIGTSNNIGREVGKGEPRDPRRVPSFKVDKQMGAGRGADGEAH
jgi:hypothetical protein